MNAELRRMILGEAAPAAMFIKRRFNGALVGVVLAAITLVGWVLANIACGGAQ